jgi:hypothetical protein
MRTMAQIASDVFDWMMATLMALIALGALVYVFHFKG